jgi:hypothetical protein
VRETRTIWKGNYNTITPHSMPGNLAELTAPAMQQNGTLRYVGAPRLTPLRRQANTAQMKLRPPHPWMRKVVEVIIDHPVVFGVAYIS